MQRFLLFDARGECCLPLCINMTEIKLWRRCHPLDGQINQLESVKMLLYPEWLV
jgi:hypothetical protein